jgi:phosphatidylinositol alpha-1,6-mannosyltransferase
MNGKPVIGGNMDGTVDALLEGEAGFLVNPDDTGAIADGIVSYFRGNWPAHLYDFSASAAKIKEKFSYNNFKDRLKRILLHKHNP